jgi:D-sedoheptulose 7-phosphate isomerase
MSGTVPPYVRTLITALLRVEASDGAGHALGFDAGFSAAVDLIRAQTERGRKVIFIGNGGSAAAASHQAVDFWKNGGMRALAFNDAALLTCISNDFGYEQVFEKPVAMFADEGDVLLAISSSGQSENVRRGVAAAVDRRCRVLTLSGFDAYNPLRKLGDVNFYVPSRSYGEVEIVHLAICHGIVDTLIAERGLTIVAPGTTGARAADTTA